MTDQAAGRDLSFLAPPDASVDWRLVVAYATAAQTGLLTALPADTVTAADRCDLDERAVRAVLGILETWDIVTRDENGCYATGPRAPTWPGDATLLTHAAVIRQWSSSLPARLRRPGANTPALPARPPKMRLDTLAARTRRLTGPVLDHCLTRFPGATRVLDLGGGHGEYSLAFAERGLHTTMQDLPEVIQTAEARGELSAAGVDLFPGDLHTTLPAGPFDLVLCSTVTNMFDATRNRSLYRRLEPIIAPGGGLAIVSYLRGRNQVAAMFAVQMLTHTDGGDAHSESDYHRWLTEAGYHPPELHDIADSSLTIVLTHHD